MVSVIREENAMLGYGREKAPNEEAERLKRVRLSAEDRALALLLVKLRTAAVAGERKVIASNDITPEVTDA